MIRDRLMRCLRVTFMRYLIAAVLVAAALLACVGARRHWLLFGTPERTLKTMASTAHEDDCLKCYSWRSLSLMRNIEGGRSRGCFRFSALGGEGEVMIVSAERGLAEALLVVRTGEGPSHEMRFVREGLGWKFDISDKLSAALRAVEE